MGDNGAKKEESIVLVVQFRPPVGGACVEFPAGLLDEHHPTLAKCCLGEMREETGLNAKLQSTSGIFVYEPGLTNATGAFTIAKVDPNDPKNGPPSPEEDEYIKVLQVPLSKLKATIDSLSKRGFLVDKGVL